MKTVAIGVRVTDACVEAIRLITQTGMSACGRSVAKPCAVAAAAKKRGKMMPPGKPPAQASAIAASFAPPTASAADTLAKGCEGSAKACALSDGESPGHTAWSGVAWHSAPR